MTMESQLRPYSPQRMLEHPSENEVLVWTPQVPEQTQKALADTASLAILSAEQPNDDDETLDSIELGYN